MVLLLVSAVAGLLLLALSADHLVLGSSRLAARTGVSAVVVGVVVIGLGTSAPEFVVSGLAAAGGHADLAAANLVGSNIINVTVILGVAALVSPVVVHSSVPRREAPITVLATVTFAGAVLLGLTRFAGVALAVASVIAVGMLVRMSTRTSGDPLPGEVGEFLADPANRPSMGPEAARTCLGLAGTLAGAQLLVTAATGVAERLGVSQALIGFTVVALGTSLPELVTAVQAQRHDSSDLLVGNLLGSNLFNSLLGGGIVGLTTSGAPARLQYPVLAAMVAVVLLTWLLLHRGYRVSRAEACLLLVAYLLTLPLLS